MFQPLVKRDFPVNLFPFLLQNTVINLQKNAFKLKFILFFILRNTTINLLKNAFLTKCSNIFLQEFSGDFTAGYSCNATEIILTVYTKSEKGQSTKKCHINGSCNTNLVSGTQ